MATCCARRRLWLGVGEVGFEMARWARRRRETSSAGVGLSRHAGQGACAAHRGAGAFRGAAHRAGGRTPHHRRADTDRRRCQPRARQHSRHRELRHLGRVAGPGRPARARRRARLGLHRDGVRQHPGAAGRKVRSVYRAGLPLRGFEKTCARGCATLVDGRHRCASRPCGDTGRRRRAKAFACISRTDACSKRPAC